MIEYFKQATIKNMQTINIKRISLSEIEQLQKICKETFYETFSELNTEENMNKYLEEGFSTEQLTIELSNRNSEFYFAAFEGKVIGYLFWTISDRTKR